MYRSTLTANLDKRLKTSDEGEWSTVSVRDTCRMSEVTCQALVAIVQVQRCDARYAASCVHSPLQVFRQPFSSAAVHRPIPIKRISMNVADLDEVQLHLFSAGVPQFELWADPGLLELPMARKLFAIASRIMYVRRLWRPPEYLRIHRRDDPADHRRFLARLRLERRLWQDHYARRVREARAALCKHDSCKREPAIMYWVLSFFGAPGFDMSLYLPLSSTV
jgi:hypothetical protein